MAAAEKAMGAGGPGPGPRPSGPPIDAPPGQNGSRLDADATASRTSGDPVSEAVKTAQTLEKNQKAGGPPPMPGAGGPPPGKGGRPPGDAASSAVSGGGNATLDFIQQLLDGTEVEKRSSGTALATGSDAKSLLRRLLNSTLVDISV